MSETRTLSPRVVVATVALARGHVGDDGAGIVSEAIVAAGFTFVRAVVVNRDKPFIRELVSHVSNENQADAIVVVGGTGFGPRDYTCEALEPFFDRRIEGFGEAYRRLLHDELEMGVTALLSRATAGTYNKCVVIAVPRHKATLRRAVHALIVPTLAEAVRLASGRSTPHAPSSGAI